MSYDQTTADLLRENAQLRDRIRELEARGIGEAEPVAWGVRGTDGRWWSSFYESRDDAKVMALESDILVPLYASRPHTPPPVRVTEAMVEAAANALANANGRPLNEWGLKTQCAYMDDARSALTAALAAADATDDGEG